MGSASSNTLLLIQLTLSSYENRALLGYYGARNRNSLQTFRDNLHVPNSFQVALEEGTDTKRHQGITTTRCVTTQKSADVSYFSAEV